MTFQELLEKVVDWLQRSERVSYRAIKRQFDLDDEYLDDLKEAILMGDSIATMADGQLHRYATLDEFVNDPTTGVGEERSFWTELGER